MLSSDNVGGPRDALLCISEAMFTRSLVKVLTGPVQPGCTCLVSRAEVAADPPALQHPLALTRHARGRAAIVAACDCWSVSAVGARENAWKERKPCVVWSQQGLRPAHVAVGVWGSQEFSVPYSFSPLILSGSLHNPKTLKQTFTIHLQKQHLRKKLFVEFLFLYRFGPLSASSLSASSARAQHASA